jgi:hypothetical protein
MVDTVIAIIRKLQHWSFTALNAEYRAFAGSRSRFPYEQLAEVFDLDLIAIPPAIILPDWFITQEAMWQDECAASLNKV